MANLQTLPLFDGNFDGFINYLHDMEISPGSISPHRFGLALHIDMQTLAANARVHRNTLRRAPDTESVQRYLRESVRVMRAATDISGSVEKAIYWYKNNPLSVFDYKTPQDLVVAGRADAVIAYIQSLAAGFSG